MKEATATRSYWQESTMPSQHPRGWGQSLEPSLSCGAASFHFIPAMRRDTNQIHRGPLRACKKLAKFLGLAPSWGNTYLLFKQYNGSSKNRGQEAGYFYQWDVAEKRQKVTPAPNTQDK